MKQRTIKRFLGSRALMSLLAILMLVPPVQTVRAQNYEWAAYVTDILLVGGSKDEVTYASDAHSSYKFDKHDINEGAGGDYIFLGAKKGNYASTNGGYITDVIVVNVGDKNPPSTVTYGGHTYHLCSTAGGDYFTSSSKGNLNSHCGKGWDIYLYYTKENFSDKRVVTGFYVSPLKDGAVNCYYKDAKLCESNIDLNRGIGSSASLYLHITTETKANRPTSDPVFEDIAFDAQPHRLIKTAAGTSNGSGTVYYSLDNSTWYSNINSDALKKMAPGRYTVHYYVDGNSYGNKSHTRYAYVQINRDSKYIKPENVTVTNVNTYAKTLQLNWTANVPSSATTAGKWYIYRNKEKVGEVNYGNSTQFTDNKLSEVPYGTPMTYTVCFVPNTWNLTNIDDALSDVKASTTFTMNRQFSFTSLTASEKTSKVKLDWVFSSIEDASGTSLYDFILERTTTDPTLAGATPTWEELVPANASATVTVNNKNTTSGTYTDATAVSGQPYWYRVKVFVEETTCYSPVAAFRLDGSSITGFAASRGEFSNGVKLSWTVDQKGGGTSNFALFRRPLGSKNESEWAQIYTTSGNVTSYSYEDQSAQAGSFNEYRLVLKEKIEQNNKQVEVVSSSATTDGFSLSTGVVSGRISFGSGTAVEGVRITMSASNSDGETENHFRSLALKSDGVGIQTISGADKVNNLVKGAFSAQCYVLPDNSGMGENNTIYSLLNVKEVYQVLMKYDEEKDRYQLGTKINGTTSWSTDSVYANRWSHITVTYDSGKTQFYVVTANGEVKASDEISGAVNWAANDATDLLTLGNNSSRDDANHFYGNVDEFRFFKKVLTEADILKNYNHTLAGNEGGLAVYWPMDEGIENGQTKVYDYSRPNGIASGNHGQIEVGALSERSVPSDEQLALMTYTDENGNYTIRGIGFSGEGTNYVLTPTMGIHQFSPTNKSRFFSLNSLVHSGVDFEDVSSFPVSGVVYYHNTTIPVADVYVKVDGVTASRDGKAVTTNSKGEFSVDVPIGDHFVSVEKSGHTFVNGGRYPEDPDEVGVRHNFDDAKAGLTFYDNTLVTVVGRVAGGDIEYEKPLGVGDGKANIGKAKLTLDYSGSEQTFINAVRTVNGNAVSYDMSENQRDFSTQYGAAYVQGNKNTITIETDSRTGEFVAQLPPLNYQVTAIQIPSNTDIVFTSLPVIDATNPNLIYTDSVETEDGLRKCEYVGSAKIEYKSQSKFIVTENEDGSFGIKNYKVKDINGTEHDVTVYTPNGDGTVNYTFGFPVYEEMGSYIYHMSAYEEYENRDNSEEVVIDRVPLAGKEVTVKNQYAATTSVLLDGEVHEVKDEPFELDDNGEAVYQFTVGYPNIQSPYTRGLSISYDNNGTQMSWDGNNTFKAIVLGSLPTGNNFVTQGPDEVLMVLRDPPGTGSSATWSKGTTITKTTGRSVAPHSNTELKASIYAGVKQETAEGIGFMVIQDLDSKATITAGGEVNLKYTNTKNTTKSVTTTRDITTSDGFDFNGADGDVFIGSAKNIIFGASHAVDIRWNNATNQPVLDMDEALATGEEFTTGFVYTQNYIKGVLIPNFEALRDSMLVQVSSISSVQRPAKGKDPIYVTTLSKDDPNYGSSNNDASVWGDAAVTFDKLKDGIYTGPSYTMLMPQDYEKNNYQDMVNFYNLQIKRWQKELSKNEEAKVTAIQNRDKWLKQNHSFDAGTTITETVTNDTTYTTIDSGEEEVNVIVGVETGYRFSGVGLGVEFTENIGITVTEEREKNDQYTLTTSYSLVEDGDDDYLSVDVFNAPDGFGPIFYTRAGATSCPYEDEVVTEFYQPGTVIMEKTVQIEKPEIEAAVQTLTGIPAGGKGTFQVYLRNNSDTKEDGWYDIMVCTDSNPDGLVVKMDGMVITTGRSVLVKAGETMNKTFTVEQSNPDVLTYENVKIRIASQCQKDNGGVFPEIADTTEISVYFQPTCSEVKLASTHTLVNNDTETVQTLSISGYNYSMTSLKGIRLQYKGENDADFRTLQEYTKDADRVASNPNLLLLPALEGTNKLNYTIDLRKDEYTDKTYVFRAITVCDQGGVEVNNESDEVAIIRDMTSPMLIATPTPASGILTSGDDLVITFNEDIQGSILSNANNFDVVGVLNESKVQHDVALSLTGKNAAKTEAAVSLNGKSFTASMWVNYQSDGTLLKHGTKDNNFTASIENEKLTLNVAGKNVPTTAALPKNKWLFLNISYNADAKTVSAGYAMDGSEVNLIGNAEVPAYEGNGIISVGGNDLTAKVQELTLWNSARSLTEAQADMYTTKNQATRGLIGYWQMNEGHGSTATDRARNRNMLLPSQNAWWVNGDNYTLTLNGSTAAAANIGTLNTTNSEDYLVETWFKADETQSGVASVLSTNVMDLRLNAQGKMEIALDGDPIEVKNANLRDGQWHHVAVNVLKSTNGSGSIYIDGELCKQISATVMPVLYGDKLMLGSHRTSVDGNGLYTYDQMLKGAIDEVRIWKGRRTGDVIKNKAYARVNGNEEPGLVAYYPMESFTLDGNNQSVSTATLVDTKSTETLSFFTAGGANAQATTGKDNTAALKPAPKTENVEFSFVASERQIKVNLLAEPAKMEGCTIFITAKNVKDKNGNKAQPITWTVFVQQNNLKWQEADVALTKTVGEQDTFTAVIENRGSESEAWSLSGLPAWLTINTEGGVLKPQTSETLTFSVAESVAIGNYEQTIYLSGNSNIAEPMTLSLKVTGNVPAWTVNPKDFENSMNVIARVEIDGRQMDDEDDLVAAFIGEECRGVAHPAYKERYDGSFITMDIYGNNESGAEVTFRAYDASTGALYPVVTPSQKITFAPLALIGNYGAPVVLTVSDLIEQQTELKAGWNWLSLYVTPDNMTVPAIFEKIADDVVNVKSQHNGYLTYENGQWGGGLTSAMSNAQMYAVQMKADRQLRIVGQRVNPASTVIDAGEGWNWIGYYGRQVASVSDALAGLGAVNGDILKGQSGVSYYDDYEWAGSLPMMEPGIGYMLKNTTARQFSYPAATVAAARALDSDLAEAESQSAFKPVSFRKYANNAIMTVRIVADDKALAHTELGVFADGECRTSALTNEKGVAFVTIPGDDEVTLTFKVAVGDELIDVTTTVNYEVDGVYGSPMNPLVIDLGSVNGIREIFSDSKQTPVYDLQGRKVTLDDNSRKLHKGVYIKNGRKVTVK